MELEYFAPPGLCPLCDTPLSDEHSLLYCRNDSCPSRFVGSVKVWIARLGLLYWGDSLVDDLIKQNKISTVADLYDLAVEDIAYSTSGIKYAQKCFDVLHSSKNMSLPTFLSALNIPNLGMSTANDIYSSGFNTLEKVLSMNQRDFESVPNIGEKTAALLFSWVSRSKDSLTSLSTKVSIIDASAGVLSGKSFCITGSTRLPRKSLQKLLSDNGATIKESVTKGLTYLISNEVSSSSKFVKAASLGVSVISEHDAVKMAETR